MNLPRGFAAGISALALAAFLPLTFLPGHAQAQQAAAAAPRIDGFDVEPLKKLTAGNELAFTLYGSPGGTASVVIGGSTKTLILVEIEAGVYEGTYTISSRDRINKDSTATANLRLGNHVASSILDESLVAGAAARWPGGAVAGSTPPKIDRFEVDPPSQLVPGAELLFTLAGSAGGSASVRINGVKGKLALEEVRPGVYEGGYTVKNRDKLAANTVVTGNLRLGTQERSMVLGQALVEGSATRPRSSLRPAGAPARAAAPVCANCGVVEAVHVVEVKGDGSYLGMIGGGVVGALLGSQVGHGTGRTVASVAGAAGGAWAGNEIEKRVKTTKHYEVVVRLANGGSQTVSYKTQPPFSVGSRVRVENGALVQI
jgi:outer membrane lipoprotein SlyB